MALPRVISLTFVRRTTQPDGSVLLAYKVDNDAIGARGYLRLVVDSSAIADDLDVNLTAVSLNVA